MFGWFKKQADAPAKVTNSTRGSNGAGTQFDMGEGLTPGGLMLGLDTFSRDRILSALYYTAWEAQKIVDIPVQDILREGWGFKGVTDEARDTLQTMDDRLGLMDALRRAMTLERLQGGSAILMGIDDGVADPAIPAGRGEIKFLNVISRQRIANTEIDPDPTSPGYGRPQFYWIGGKRIHRSRLMLFEGAPLTPVADTTVIPIGMTRNDGFGISVLTRVYDDIMRAIGTRQGAYQLVQRASVIIASMQISDLEAGGPGQAVMRQLQDIVNQISLYRGAVIETLPGATANPISTMSASFGSVPELLMSYLQVLAAGSDVPATRFIGQAPGGLNATGDSDLENYYGRLESQQKIMLRPMLLRYYRHQGGALGDGWNERSFDIEFPPLWSMSEVEEAGVRAQDTAGIVSLVGAAIITEDEAIAQLKDRKVLTVEITGASDGYYPADTGPEGQEEGTPVDAGEGDTGAEAGVSGGIGPGGGTVAGADGQFV